MDKTVLDAMARWPDVPHVYGWLSLDERGQWRLHSDGSALAQPENPGELISSAPIVQFIGRNYAADDEGQWYFQNGPQRVYVRLDAAPFILHTVCTPNGGLALRTHNDLDAGAVTEWLLADDGKLYARTARGAGLLQGRDLQAVISLLQTSDGTPLLAALESGEPVHPIRVTSQLASDVSSPPGESTAIWRSCPASQVQSRLGFQCRPRPEKS